MQRTSDRGPPRRSVLLLLALATSGCAALRNAPESPSAGDFYTTVHLEKDEALELVFPDAARIVPHDLVLSEEERAEAERVLGRRLLQRRFDAYLGVAPGGDLDGYAIIQNEIGKFKPFTFIAGVEPDGSVRRVAVLIYREARGGEVAHRRFLVQYRGKTLAHPIDKNRDIINIQGATMSVDSMNHGVKKVLAAIDAAYRRHPERVDALLRQPREATEEPKPHPGPKAAPESSDAVGEVRETRLLMGALCEIQAFGREREATERAVRAAFLEIEAIERALSDYRADSELSALNRDGWTRPLPISETTAAFLREAKELARRSGGAADVTVGPLVDAWGFRSRAYRVPAAGELEELRPLIGSENIALEPAASGWSARLAREGMRLDPGALGKGFAIDRAARVLEQHGIDSALLGFSSTVYAIGSPPGAERWDVAVRDPAAPERIIGCAGLKDEALAASGSSEKSFERDSVRYSHILSPFTLAPVRNTAGAVVIAPAAGLADGLATAACVLGRRALELLERERVTGLVVVLEPEGAPEYLSTPAWKEILVKECR